MANAGDVVEIPELGFRLRFLRTTEDTGGELLEYEVSGQTRGVLAQEHVHNAQTERFEPLAGAMRVVVRDGEHLLQPGDAYEVPPGTPHRQLSLGDGGTVRISIRPAGSTEALIEIGRAHV
jgi:mannose-6-phosphate isomerase-like protein (cupin superfamily)